MKTKTMIIGITGLAFGLLAYSGKMMNLAGSNELLLLGTLVIIFGFLLPITLRANHSKNNGDIHTINWLGFIGLAALLIGITLVVLKYFLAAMFLLLLGSIGAVLHFALTSNRLGKQS